jgi:hypothetical protein
MEEYLPLTSIEHYRIIFNILSTLIAVSIDSRSKYIDILKLSLETP